MTQSPFIILLSILLAFCLAASLLIRNSNTALRAALQVMTIAALILSVFAWNLESYLEEAQLQIVPDFLPIYVGGRLITENPAGLYDHDVQFQFLEDTLGRPLLESDYFPFPYPPLTAFALAPLGWLPFETAGRMLILVNLLVLGCITYVLQSRLRLSDDRLRVLTLLIATFLPVYLTLQHGELSLLLTFVYTATLLALWRKKETAVGLTTALLTAKPTLVPLVVFYLLVSRRWKALAVSAAASITLWTVGFAWTGWHALSDYQALMREMAEGQDISLLFSCSLRGLDVWLGAGNTLWWAGVVLVCWLFFRARAWPQTEWTLICLTFGVMLIAPHLVSHDLVLIIPALAFYLATRGFVNSFEFYALMLFNLSPIFLFVGSPALGLSLQPGALSLLMAAGFAYAYQRWSEAASPSMGVSETPSPRTS